MVIDKTQIKEIKDGQLGSEVAANMKSNFDMLADGINKNKDNVDSVEARLKWAELGYLPQWFKDALVCYYDPNRQGLRNVDDINGKTFLLKDFSPNHLDMEMHNFKGGGVSGMNGLGHQGWYKGFRTRDIEGKSCTADEYTDNKVTVTITSFDSNPRFQVNSAPNKYMTWEEHYIKIDGLSPDDSVLVFYYTGNKDTKKSVTCKGNGIFKIPKSYATETEPYPQWMRFSVKENKTITIEQLPLRKGALLFDGVDDFGESHNQPKQEGSVISNIESFPYSFQNGELRLGGQGEPQPLYQFLRFNRFLTEDEIRWVKAKFLTTPKLIESTESTPTEVQP